MKIVLSVIFNKLTRVMEVVDNNGAIIYGIIIPSVMLIVMSLVGVFLADPMIGDGKIYWELSADIIKNNAVVSDGYHSYVYPKLLATLRSIIGDDLLYIIFFQKALYVISFYLFTLSYIKTDKVMVIILSLSPFLLYYTNTLLTEALYIPLLFITFSIIGRITYSKNVSPPWSLNIFLLIIALVLVSKDHLLFYSLFFMVTVILLYGKNKIVLAISFLIFVGVLVLPLYLTGDGFHSGGNIKENAKMSTLRASLYVGMHEYSQFPYSTDYNTNALNDTLEYIEKFKDRDFDYATRNSSRIILNYIYKIYRVWVPSQHHEGKSLAVMLSVVYASILFYTMILGIYYGFKHHKNSKLFWVMLIPLLVLWGQQILLHMESRYMLPARINQAYFVMIFYNIVKVQLLGFINRKNKL